MNVGVVSLGCVKNRVDTEEMLSFLKKDGFQFVKEEDQAQVLIVNTCGFINSAKEESIDTILELARYKQDGQCQVLCVTGCLAQRYGQELMQQIPEIDVLVGVSQYPALSGLIKEALSGTRQQNIKRGADFSGCGRVLTTKPYTAYVRIAEGCDNRCAYCAIPLIRGSFRSRPMDSILSEMVELAQQGAKEQILIAQDTSRYGLDQNGQPMLPELMAKAADTPGLSWLRILYCYPDSTDRRLIDTMAANPKICRYLDLPLQHAAPSMLSRMNRRGSIHQVEDLLLYARERGFALRTTMIVGFPGETEAEFQQLMDFCGRMRFDRLGAFAFSREEDTKAYHMKDQVPEDIKNQRLDALLKMQQEISLANNQLRVGTTDRALVVGKQGRHYLGRTAFEAPDSDGLVQIHSEQPLLEGKFVNIKITKALPYDLIAQAQKEEKH